jgi:hypothetical protein
MLTSPVFKTDRLPEPDAYADDEIDLDNEERALSVALRTLHGERAAFEEALQSCDPAPERRHGRTKRDLQEQCLEDIEKEIANVQEWRRALEEERRKPVDHFSLYRGPPAHAYAGLPEHRAEWERREIDTVASGLRKYVRRYTEQNASPAGLSPAQRALAADQSATLPGQVVRLAAWRAALDARFPVPN